MKSSCFYPLLATFVWLVAPFTASAATNPTTYLTFSSGITVIQEVQSDNGVDYRINAVMKNAGSSALSWKATLSSSVQLVNLWGATQTTSGGVTTLYGSAPVNAGQSASWGYEGRRILNPPALSLSASAIGFGNQGVGFLASRSLVLKNTGSGSLSISSLALSGAQAGEFAASGCVTTIAPGASCTATVKFRPQAAGTRSATLTVNGNVPSQKVSLSGSGVQSASSANSYLSFSSGVSVTQKITDDNGSSYRVELTVKNITASSLNWAATLSNAVRITSLWGANQSTVNGAVKIRGASALGAGQSVSWGYRATRVTAVSTTTTPPSSGSTTTSPGSTTPTSGGTSGSTTPAAPASLTFTHNGTTLSAASVANGQTLTITPKLTANAAASNMIVDIEIYNSAGTQVHQKYFGGQSFAANVTKSFPYGYAVNLPAGSYRVAVGVFDGAWTNKLWVNSAASFSVAASATTSPTPTPTPTPAPSPSTVGFKTANGQILDGNGASVQIRGINMFGFNADILAPQYLWAMNWKAQIQQVKNLGFNTIRVPFVPDTLYFASAAGGIDSNLNPDLAGKTPLQVLDLWLAEVDRQGLNFVLDFHSVAKGRQNSTWYTNDGSITWNGQPYTEDYWVRDLVFVAKRYAHLPRFMGIDLYNEPTGEVRWGSSAGGYTAAADWKRASEKAGKAILAANPKLMIFVEGISNNYDGAENDNTPINWGENLRPQAYAPIQLPNNKLVLIPHSYGPDVFQKPTFSDPSFPSNLTRDWEDLFGRFYPQYMVVMGEFGGRYGTGPTGSKDKAWQDAFVNYLIGKNMRSTFYWCYSPNSGDTGGILDDNLQVIQSKMDLLRRLWGSAATTTTTTTSTTTTTTPPPSSTTSPTTASGPLTLISRGLRVYASSGNAADAVDANYNSEWRSSGVPATLAFDLSTVPAASRQKVLLAWYNDSSYGYSHTLVGQPGYNNPGAYTIEANPAAGGSTPPASGWVKLAQVSANTKHSLQHVLNLGGYSWLRMNFTASDGSAGNADIAINVDLYNAGSGVGDGWFFAGDSITANCMSHRDTNGTQAFGTLINASNPPPQENAGVPGWTSNDLLGPFAGWVAAFPGKYVTINLGTNDAGGGLAPSQYYQNLSQLVQTVLNAGKVPVVPTIPYSTSPAHQANIPGLNSKIRELYTAYPAVIRGPDLYAHFQANPSQLGDGLHPNEQGCAAYRQAWANTARSVH